MVQADLVQVSSFGNSISDIWKSSFALLISVIVVNVTFPFFSLGVFRICV